MGDFVGCGVEGIVEGDSEGSADGDEEGRKEGDEEGRLVGVAVAKHASPGSMMSP